MNTTIQVVPKITLPDFLYCVSRHYPTTTLGFTTKCVLIPTVVHVFWVRYFSSSLSFLRTKIRQRRVLIDKTSHFLSNESLMLTRFPSDKNEGCFKWFPNQALCSKFPINWCRLYESYFSTELCPVLPVHFFKWFYKISFHPQPCLLFPYIDINPIFFQTTPVPNLRIAINFHPDFIILSINKTHVTNLPQKIHNFSKCINHRIPNLDGTETTY